MSMRPSALLIFVVMSLALTACGSSSPSDNNLDTLDAELTNGADAANPARDPAVMSALESQIMVDPALAQQSNADALKPADQPYSAQIPTDSVADGGKSGPAIGPLMKAPAAKPGCPACETAKQAVTLGGLAARQKSNRTAQCVGGMRYSAGWATRMPEALPIYPQARLIEAAGNDRNGCALRAASFVTGAEPQAVLDYYYTRATTAGYASEHQAADGEHMLGGNRTKDQAAFILFARPRDGGGTEVDVIANSGR